MVDISRYAALGDDAHINLRTFRRSGDPVDTPVWFVEFGNSLYLRTVRDSGKVRRLIHHPRVRYASCMWNGELTGHWQEGRARVLQDSDPLIDHVHVMMEKKYGDYRREMTALMAKLNKSLCYIEITPDTGA